MSAPVELMGGRFRALAKLGSGGMADVFLGEQVSLGRKVALKILKRDVRQSPGMAERFDREAKLLCTVDHPAVVRIIDFDRTGENPVLVMEYVEGPRLDQVIQAGPVSPERAVKLLSQLAHGLGAIHAAGIVHRDIKLENVVVQQVLHGEQARLLDFGIARLLEPDKNDFKSDIHTLLGTPAYISPEQTLGEQPDARSDVYSFGVLAWRVLTGKLLFPGPTAKDLFDQHQSAKVPELTSLAPQLSAWPELVKLVHRCLEKKPEARYPDGHQLALAFERVTGVFKPTADLGADVVMMVNTADLVAPEPARPFRFLAMLLVAALVAASPLLAIVRPWEPAARAALLTRFGDPAKAQQLLDASPQPESPAWLRAKAETLLARGDTDGVKKLLDGGCHRVLLAGSPSQLLPNEARALQVQQQLEALAPHCRTVQ